MTNRLRNKTALITGASSGIGKACAKMLASYGVNLILCARRLKRLEELKKSLPKDINIEIFTLDVTDKNEVSTKIDNTLKNNNIDILINNAGLALGFEKIDEGSIDNWERMIDTNIKGLLYVSKPIMSHMRENNFGHIINLGSITGQHTYPGHNIYCATKHAVHSLTESMNVDLLGTNIKASTIAPGTVKTEFSNVRFEDDKKAQKAYQGMTPLCANDVAELITYILNTPSSVNIQHALIMPTAQRNPYLVDRTNS